MLVLLQIYFTENYYIFGKQTSSQLAALLRDDEISDKGTSLSAMNKYIHIFTLQF